MLITVLSLIFIKIVVITKGIIGIIKLIPYINDNKEVDNKDFKMNWDDYKDKLIILSSNELNIHNINKIEDKCVFFT